MAYRYVRHLALVLFIFLAPHFILSQQPNYTRNVAIGLDHVWEILWGPDNRIWFTERTGRISRLDPETGVVKRLAVLGDVLPNGETGLLGMTLHPDFPDSPYIYVVYTHAAGTNRSVECLARLRYSADTLLPDRLLLDSIPASVIHGGSRLQLTPDRKLLMTCGDAGNSNMAQSHQGLYGKILRMNLDGSVPPDNPWANAPYPASLMWTTGHRNPQGLVLAPNGILYSSEHGLDTDDEINIIKRGGNYGWPFVHGYCDDRRNGVPDPNEGQFCRDSNVVEPIRTWSPSIAPCGLDYYNGDRFPEWKHSLLLTTLKEQDLRQLKLSTDGRSIVSETVLLNNYFGRLRDLCISPGGRIFVSTSNGVNYPGQPTGDRIIELMPGAFPGSLVLAPIDPDSLYAADTITVSFTASGPFDPSNIFRIQVSDGSGSFAAPTLLDTVKGTTGASVQVTLPCRGEKPDPNRFRLRVVATSPDLISNDNGRDIALNTRASLPITITHPSVICPDDSVMLEASAGFDYYSWSTGEQTRQIIVFEPGDYQVWASKIGYCDWVGIKVKLDLAPSPDTPTVTQQGNLLTSSPAIGYQWLRRGVEGWRIIDGATSRSYTVTQSGIYTVRALNENGCGRDGEPLFAEVSEVPDVDDAIGDPGIDWSPISGRLVVHLRHGSPGRIEIAVVDMAGKQVAMVTEDGAGRSYRKELDLAPLPVGVYLVNVHAGGKEWVRKVVRE